MATPTATLNKEINTLIITALTGIIEDISISYNLDKKELIEKYIKKPIVRKPVEKKKKISKDELIETQEYEWDGETYLVDKKNNVYSNDPESPLLIGERLVDGTILFKNQEQ